MKIKAIALLSGGLDSILAAKLILDQGLEVLGASFFMTFNRGTVTDLSQHPAALSAHALGIEYIHRDISDEFMGILENPAHGYGSEMNPCLDCRILTLATGRKMMEETGARFIITGEVLNQRPMSQKLNMLRMTEKASGLQGLVLRPLSARQLDPTIPELQGWVDRNRLLDIKGRSRKIQLALAKSYGITSFTTPAGGCLLTDPTYARRLVDLMENRQLTLKECEKLRYGRHFRLSPRTKLVIGREEKDNEGILRNASAQDILIECPDIPGPMGLLVGDADEAAIAFAARAVLSYIRSDRPGRDKVRIHNGLGIDRIIPAEPLENRDELKKMMLV